MLDWFRNEMNLIVHNYRMKGTMTKGQQAQRMKDLGVSVAYETYALLTVPHHIVISDSAYDDLVAINLVEPDRVHMIYNGVNEGNFRPNPTARKEFLSKHSVPANAFVVGCGGRLEGIKGHHQMSKAMDVILRRHKNVVLLVAGTGGEASRYEALKAQGLAVHLLGMMTQTDLAAFYQSLDVFVDPFYQHHGLNTVMIEATLCGVPLVATRLASAATTVPNNAFGRSFGLGLIPELVHAIESLMLNPAERSRIGRNVRERAIRLFTSTVMANSYETLLYHMYLHPVPLHKVTGPVVCKRAYPAMCYREPEST
jgi:glycosyltransferase involved in cell wall biosynthesis